jgi:hypothetical protein
MEHLMLIARYGSIVAGIGRVAALDHPGVRGATTADAPQRRGMRQQVLEPPLTYIGVKSCNHTFRVAGNWFVWYIWFMWFDKRDRLARQLDCQESSFISRFRTMLRLCAVRGAGPRPPREDCWLRHAEARAPGHPVFAVPAPNCARLPR